MFVDSCLVITIMVPCKIGKVLPQRDRLAALAQGQKLDPMFDNDTQNDLLVSDASSTIFLKVNAKIARPQIISLLVSPIFTL